MKSFECIKMNQDITKFFSSLTGLSDDQLMSWARGFYINAEIPPRPPFRSIEDRMDVLLRTWGLLNQDTDSMAYHPLMERFEKVLVQLFADEAYHPFTHPGILHNFVFMFTN